MSRNRAETDPKNTEIVRIGSMTFDLAARELRDLQGNPVTLRSQSAEVLAHLALHSGKVVERGDLIAAVWPDTFVTDDSLVQCIADIRRALGADGREMVQTHARKGYRLLTSSSSAVPATWSPRGPTWTVATVLLAASLLGLMALGIWLLQQGDTVTRKPSIAVLPFDNLGGDEATGRLARGLTEDIITDLARFPEVDVVARNSTAQFASGADVRTIGAILDVAFVLEGSIQRAGDQVRLTAQLIDAANGTHIWSERWDRPTEDLFAVQTEIADQVANRIGGGAGLVQTAGREAARRKRPESLSAHELYLLGTEAIEKFTPEDNARAIRLLMQAVEIDPGFARAWIELSHAHGLAEGFGGDAAAAKKAAMAAAERAVSLDPLDAEAHAVLGIQISGAGDFVRAEAAFETALKLSPGSAEILAFYACRASTFGKPQLGAEIVDRIIRLNPSYPMWQNGIFGGAYFMARRFEDAALMYERIPPGSLDKFRIVMKASTYAALGRKGEASAVVVETLGEFPDLTVQEFVSDPGWADSERVLLAKWMQVAGFPLCVKADVVKALPDPFRLSECL
jgi:TolB-like protein/DNA-binding winged helix-turn-helix (wHTH) protein